MCIRDRDKGNDPGQAYLWCNRQESSWLQSAVLVTSDSYRIIFYCCRAVVGVGASKAAGRQP